MIYYKKFPEPMKIMNISSPLRTLPQLLALLLALASTLPLIHARVGEQENWYLAKEIILETEDYSQSIEIIEINGSETIAKFHASEIVLISLDGSKISYNTPLAHIYETVNLHNGGVIISASFNEVKVDDDTTELFYWNVNNGMQFTKINDSSGNSILTNSMNKNSLSLSQDNQRIIVCDPEDKLIVYKINQANAELPPELTKLNEISIPIVGGAPGEKYSIIPIFVEDDLLLFSDSENFHFFTTSGEFKKRTVPYPSHYGSIGQILETNNQGQILTTKFILDPEGDPIVRLFGNSLNSNVYSYGWGSGFHDACFSNKGNLCILDNTNTLRYFKKAYRTKGTTTQNEIPKPVIQLSNNALERI